MRDRYIPPLITLTAGAVTCIFDIYRKADLLDSLKRLLLVLIIFYIIGLIAMAVIRKTLEPKNKIDNKSGDQTADQDTDSEAEDDRGEQAEDSK